MAGDKQRDGLVLSSVQWANIKRMAENNKWQGVKSQLPRTTERLLELGIIEQAPFGSDNYRLTAYGLECYRKFKARSAYDCTFRAADCPRCHKRGRVGKRRHCQECGEAVSKERYIRKLELAQTNPDEYERRYGGKKCGASVCEEPRYKNPNGLYSSYCKEHKRLESVQRRARKNDPTS